MKPYCAVTGFKRSYSADKNALLSSYVIYAYAFFYKTHENIKLNGNINVITEIPVAIKFGNKAYFGIPSGKKFDHVKLPKL